LHIGKFGAPWFETMVYSITASSGFLTELDAAAPASGRHNKHMLSDGMKLAQLTNCTITTYPLMDGYFNSNHRASSVSRVQHIDMPNLLQHCLTQGSSAVL
jgi:hypothetical protein